MAFVYIIENSINDKVYVGYTTQTLLNRWKGHRHRALHGVDTHFYRALRLYGTDSFQIRPLVECEDTEKAKELERLWILLLGSSVDGYNTTLGGDAPKHSEETKIKIGNLQKGKALSRFPNWRKAMSDPEYRKKRSLMTKQLWATGRIGGRWGKKRADNEQ